MPNEKDLSNEIPDAYAIQSQLALPYMPTPHYAIEHMISLIKKYYASVIQQPLHVIDLGSGDGRVVHALAKDFPQWNIRGIEINRELCESGQKMVQGLPNAHINWGDLFQEDLTGIDIVFLFALPTIMSNLRHIFDPLTKHALIVSFRYPLVIPGFPVKEVFHESLHANSSTFQFFAYQKEVQ